jgi:photosystem II stability/assembly factor-like uncharacterized protein
MPPEQHPNILQRIAAMASSSFSLDTVSDQIPMKFADRQHGWILSQSGLLRTQNGGRTWTAE